MIIGPLAGIRKLRYTMTGERSSCPRSSRDSRPRRHLSCRDYVYEEAISAHGNAEVRGLNEAATVLATDNGWPRITLCSPVSVAMMDTLNERRR